jgi:hypothetical protein
VVLLVVPRTGPVHAVTVKDGGLWLCAALCCALDIGAGQPGQRARAVRRRRQWYLVMVSPSLSSVQLQRERVVLLKARRGGSSGRSGEAWLVAVIISGHHHDLLPRRRGGWGHQLHLRHCVLS